MSETDRPKAPGPCRHITAIQSVRQPESPGCTACLAIGGRWVHLRTCQECGVTLCCDSSPNRHASRHAGEAGHPVAASAEPGEYWLYCYPDDSYAEYDRG